MPLKPQMQILFSRAHLILAHGNTPHIRAAPKHVYMDLGASVYHDLSQSWCELCGGAVVCVLPMRALVPKDSSRRCTAAAVCMFATMNPHEL